MKKTSISVYLFVCCVYFILGAVVYATPQIEFVEGTTFDFGNVQANEQLTHVFVFKNAGDTMLKIENVKGG